MSRSSNSPSSLARCCRCPRPCLGSSSPNTTASFGTTPPPHDGSAATRSRRGGNALAGQGHPVAVGGSLLRSLCLA